MSVRSILLAAVEPSGDALGAALYSELKKKFPDAEFFGCGGPKMAAEGFESLFPIDAFAVMGFTDVAKAMPEGFRRARELADQAAHRGADAAILIDGWAFSRIAAKRLRQHSPGTKLYKYAAPQVWASRPQRVDFVKDHFDGVLTLLPFEPDYFTKVGVPAEFVGNPTFQTAWRQRGDGEAFRARHNLGDATVLAVLPGSRRGEIGHLLEPFGATVAQLRARLPGLKVIAPLAPSIAEQAQQEMAQWAIPVLFVEPAEKYDAFAAADAALAASGTVTTELAINGAPMIVAYRTDWLTAFWARRVMTSRFASILNVTANEEIIPEFLQDRCNPTAMADALYALLTKNPHTKDQKQAFPKLLEGLCVAGRPAAAQAADQIARWLS